MPLREVIIDEQTREDASEERRIEWEVNIRELLEPSTLVARQDADRLFVDVTQQRIGLRMLGATGEPLCEVDLTHDDLADTIREYVDIVRQIARTDGPGGLNRLEALDMAKKVTHDRAARFIKRRCRAMGFDHPTARRLFTLLLSLRVDTTRLIGVHGHRRIR